MTNTPMLVQCRRSARLRSEVYVTLPAHVRIFMKDVLLPSPARRSIPVIAYIINAWLMSTRTQGGREKALDKWGLEKKKVSARHSEPATGCRHLAGRAREQMRPVCRLSFFSNLDQRHVDKLDGANRRSANPRSSTAKFPGSRTPRAQCCHVAIDQTSLISHTKGSLCLRIMPSASGQRRCLEVARRRS